MYIPTYPSVEVFNARFLPGRARMTEVDFHSEFLLQPLVLQKENVIVEGNGLYLRKSLLHTQERAFHVPYRDRQDALHEARAGATAHQDEEQPLA